MCDDDEDVPCPLCGRPMVAGASVSEHHLIPRRYKGRETVTLHQICHDKIHAVLTDAQLKAVYHTIERLRDHPDIAAFVRWIARKPPEFIDGHAVNYRRR